MRLFIAINFPDVVKVAIIQVRDSLKESALCGNFSADENLHLTLVFCEYNVLQAEMVKSIVKEIRFSEFMIALGKVGRFIRN